MAEIPGTDEDDELIGTLEDDLLIGGEGDDDLDGGPGEDVLVGGDDDDTLAGGPDGDRDEFAIDFDDGEDIIVDFDPGPEEYQLDKIVLIDGTPDDIDFIVGTAEEHFVTGDAVLTYGDTEVILAGISPEFVSGYWFVLA